MFVKFLMPCYLRLSNADKWAYRWPCMQRTVHEVLYPLANETFGILRSGSFQPALQGASGWRSSTTYFFLFAARCFCLLGTELGFKLSNPTEAGVAKNWKSLHLSHACGNAFRRILAAPLQSALMQYPALHRYNPRSIRRPENTGCVFSFPYTGIKSPASDYSSYSWMRVASTSDWFQQQEYRFDEQYSTGQWLYWACAFDL